MDCGALTGWLSGAGTSSRDAKPVSIVGGARTVVDTGSLKIDEVVGNVVGTGVEDARSRLRDV